MWIRIPVCFELLSPMHIGFLPNAAGTVVAPTRPYVPGKNLWGAVTASLAERMFDSPRPENFAAVGGDLRRSAIFSYFYLSDGEQIFVPSYETGELSWAGLSDSEFRARFIESRMSTQISKNGAAQDGSLHEIEFVRHRVGSPATGTKPTLLCGVVWVARDGKIADERLEIEGASPVRLVGKSRLPLFADLTVGGERNYGFGRVRCVRTPDNLGKKLEAIWPAEFSRFGLKGPLLGHSTFSENLSFKGLVEIVASREYPQHGKTSYELPGRNVLSSGYFFAPGTVVVTSANASLDPIGRIVLKPAPIPDEGCSSHSPKSNSSPTKE